MDAMKFSELISVMSDKVALCGPYAKSDMLADLVLLAETIEEAVEYSPEHGVQFRKLIWLIRKDGTHLHSTYYMEKIQSAIRIFGDNILGSYEIIVLTNGFQFKEIDNESLKNLA